MVLVPMSCRGSRLAVVGPAVVVGQHCLFSLTCGLVIIDVLWWLWLIIMVQLFWVASCKWSCLECEWSLRLPSMRYANKDEPSKPTETLTPIRLFQVLSVLMDTS